MKNIGDPHPAERKAAWRQSRGISEPDAQARRAPREPARDGRGVAGRPGRASMPCAAGPHLFRESAPPPRNAGMLGTRTDQQGQRRRSKTSTRTGKRPASAIANLARIVNLRGSRTCEWNLPVSAVAPSLPQPWPIRFPHAGRSGSDCARETGVRGSFCR